MNLFLSSCFSFQTRTDLVLANFYFNAAVWRFSKTFRKFAGKRLWWKPYLGKFKLFKVDSGKGIFLSVFRAPVSGCFQTLNRYAFFWMITLVQIFQSHQRFVKKCRLFLIKYPWYFGTSNCFVIGEYLRKQALLKKFNATYLRKRKSNSRSIKPWK